ncbi:hypothetical protein HA402_006322 [Bradysia odoriphaga]|nr:hypothetical protein HA402_006322 [Bradysia odoriphaga]
MSGYRKRKSSDSLEGDRKRIPLERYDYGPFKQECDNAQVSQRLYSAVPYNYVASSVATVAASGGVQNTVVYSRPRYYNSQYMEPYRSDDRNVISSVRNYSSGLNDVLPSAYYDKGRQMNFKHEVYINSLRQSEPRVVNFNDLRRHLSDIDIRYVYNWNFSTALDLTLELESSLNYFVDTRNELVFLRKIQRTQCIPFSYNEINITNRNGMYNRMRFLEDESSYRSNRMNQLFNQLQSVVIPAIIDDIRYIHSVSYEKAWTNRARYWFTLFKRIKWEHRATSDGFKNQQSKHRRPYRRYANKNEADSAGKVNFKTEKGVVPKVFLFDAKSVKVEKQSKVPQGQPKNAPLPKQDPIRPPENHIQTVSHIGEHRIPSGETNNPPVSDNIVQPSRPDIETTKNVEISETVGADKESDRSNSCVIVEQDVSLVDVKDDDNNDDSGINDNPPEGDSMVNECD